MGAGQAAITELLTAVADGDVHAQGPLFEQIYEHLRVLAASQRRRWVGNETVGTTALVSEAYLKLVGGSVHDHYVSRAHFFATASKAMRQILVSYAEQQRAEKRGGNQVRVTLDDASTPKTAVSLDGLLDVARAIEVLEQQDPRRGRIVECRLFGGMTIEETAEACQVSETTVKREWRVAKAWLTQVLEESGGNG